MSYNILPTRRFEKELKKLAKKYPSLKQEFAALIRTLSSNPETGTFIGNHCYKIRLSIASKNKGKRGGARVITYLFIQTETVYLLTIYDKAEKENVSDKELEIMVKSLEI
ncbi:MAG: type II toxin-antitoxin system RelE/ParE family toxin [Bacteroidetes bacterium]|nr:type II toxin-antitoxin system RelE/ParE family toxin [Bacteroidota bacterium]